MHGWQYVTSIMQVILGRLLFPLKNKSGYKPFFAQKYQFFAFYSRMEGAMKSAIGSLERAFKNTFIKKKKTELRLLVREIKQKKGLKPNPSHHTNPNTRLFTLRK